MTVETWPSARRRMRSPDPGATPARLAHSATAVLALALVLSGWHAWDVLRLDWRRMPATITTEPGDPPAQTDPAAGFSPIFTPEVQAWKGSIQRWAEQYALSPDLVATVMQIESCGDPGAQSSAGARGLFQVMPFHFAGGEDPLDVETNAQRGLAYLQRALELAGGDSTLALAGYNGGHGLIGRPALSWPAETRRYVHWGSGILADAQAGRSSSERLQEWLAAGGASLCSRASHALSQ